MHKNALILGNYLIPEFGIQDPLANKNLTIEENIANTRIILA